MDSKTPPLNDHQPSTSSSDDLEPKIQLKPHLIPNLNSYHPSPSRTIYSDRFIPSRSSSNFALFHLNTPSHSSNSDDSTNAYTSLLRTALFGPDSAGVVPPVTPEKFGGINNKNLHVSSPNNNIFKFKTETRRSLHSLSPFGFDDQLPGVSHSPVKTPRKVPRSPYKVLSFSLFKKEIFLFFVQYCSLGFMNFVDFMSNREF